MLAFSMLLSSEAFTGTVFAEEGSFLAAEMLEDTDLIIDESEEGEAVVSGEDVSDGGDIIIDSIETVEPSGGEETTGTEPDADNAAGFESMDTEEAGTEAVTEAASEHIAADETDLLDETGLNAESETGESVRGGVQRILTL